VDGLAPGALIADRGRHALSVAEVPVASMRRR
jgi:hypothetical protein